MSGFVVITWKLGKRCQMCDMIGTLTDVSIVGWCLLICSMDIPACVFLWHFLSCKVYAFLGRWLSQPYCQTQKLTNGYLKAKKMFPCLQGMSCQVHRDTGCSSAIMGVSRGIWKILLLARVNEQGSRDILIGYMGSLEAGAFGGNLDDCQMTRKISTLSKSKVAKGYLLHLARTFW